ncbi:hypothetical protein A3A42_01625 [Candidatus Kaiserbacteria bacterium RIFCSPLOWO2_01_FULL_55_25]|nr:MAG: hypothetical protein A3A42_01625 [Candidatus Kaiserbacteria bacterium RIFCSPLOWO2_01_FULL_55_25]
MRAFHFYHGHRMGMHFSDFWLYELSMWFHTLAHSLVNIFIPILMLKSGYDIKGVVLFYLLFNIIDVPLNFVARTFVRLMGARFSIVVATCATIAFFWIFLRIHEPTLTILFLLAALAAVYDTFYWVAHFFLFMESGGTSKQASNSTGIMYAVRQGAIILGPATGAVILIFFSQTALLYVTIAGLLLSLVPLIALSTLPDKPQNRGLMYGEFFSLPQGKVAFLSTAFYALHDAVESTLFPIFIFLLFKSIESVAIIPILISVAAMITALMVGRIKPRLRRLALILGTLAIASTWVVRLVAGDPTIYYASILLVSICVYFVLIPIDSAIFEHALRTRDPLSASMYRNVAFMFTNAILFAVLMLFLNIFEPSFAIAIAGLLALGVLHLIPMKFIFRQPPRRHHS